MKQRKIKRIGVKVTNDGTELKKKRKQPSLPPTNNKVFIDILDVLYARSPVLCQTVYMQALCGLRYSDVSWLRYDDFINENGQYVDRFELIQQKIYNMAVTRITKRNPSFSSVKVEQLATLDATMTIYVNEQMIDIVYEQRRLNPTDIYIFSNKNVRSQNLPMDIRSVQYHLNKVSKELNLNFPLATHSFRKFFAKTLINKGVTVEKLRDLLGQKNLLSTNHYLVTSDDDLAKTIQSLKYSDT